jgi:predicted ribosomally synthesized peptide with SipW-like signal peptide
MKKILLSMMVIGLVGTVIGSGVFAFFSDTETATGSFTSGTLNLQVGASDPSTETLTLSNLKPSDAGTVSSWLVTNIGSINGTLDLALGAITNNENTRSEVETAAGDTSDDTGELGTLLKLALWMDTNKDGAWSSNDYYLSSAGAKISWSSGSTLPSAAYDILNNFASKTYTGIQTVNGTADAGNFKVEYYFPEGGSVDNVVQSDGCSFNINFVLNQQ